MATIAEVRNKVAAYIAAHPELSYKTISEKLDCSESTIATIARAAGINRRPRVMANLDLSVLGGE